MLLLTRRIGDAVTIGGDIVVRVVRIEAGQVCVGIDAPRCISIRRDNAKKAAPRPGAGAEDYDPIALGC